MAPDHLFLAYLPNLYWHQNLLDALNQNPALAAKVPELKRDPLRELMLALTTKLAVLKRVVDHFNTNLDRLQHLLRNDEQRVRTFLGRSDAAYPIRDRELPFDIVLDIDAFVFETRSTYEIFGAFLREFFKRVLGETVDEDALKKVLQNQGIDTRWIEELKNDRISFFHHTAPWIAGRIASQELRFELLVLKRDVPDLSNADEYISFEELRHIHTGFDNSQAAILAFLTQRVQDFK